MRKYCSIEVYWDVLNFQIVGSCFFKYLEHSGVTRYQMQQTQSNKTEISLA